MKKVQFRVLYREFLFRIVDLELISAHGEGDSRRLLGQFAALLVFCSVILALFAGIWAASVKNDRVPAVIQLVDAWTMEHFLIATTMLVVGIFAVLSWDSTFPDRRDVLVLGPLPVSAGTLFLAKVAAVAASLGLTLAALHVVAGIAWPLALAQYGSTPAPALVFDAALPPVLAGQFPAVMNRDIAPLLGRLDLAATDGGAGIVIGVSTGGVRRVMTYGAARPDSIFEIGSISKTFTGLLLARMAVEGHVDLRDPVRALLPVGAAAHHKGVDITLADLATHHSGLPFMPENTGPASERESFTNYHAADLDAYLQRHGLERPANADFSYSNLGFAVLGAALAHRAGESYPDLLRREITGPLDLRDTAVALSPEQRVRLMQGYGYDGKTTPAWDLDTFASAGGIRSTAGDMLTYLEDELHPERTPRAFALAKSQVLRDYVSGSVRIALAWEYDPATGVFAHDGATGGFTSYACFDPRRDFAAVVFLNAHPVRFPITAFLAEHVRQRLSGEPALSLSPVTVPPAGPVRSFFAFGVTMLAAGVFTFCCVLVLQGLAALVLPRRWFLRVSAVLQLAVFCLLVCGYFLQRAPANVLVTGSRQPWLAWIPSYWFVGLYQQMSGALHPALAPFARRAWIGLAVGLTATAAAYAGSYLRALRKIVEEPDVAPSFRNARLPRFGGAFVTAIVQFSLRSLLRSRRHRMIYAFYLGVACAFAILFLNAPRSLSGPGSGSPWDTQSIPLLASTIILLGVTIVAARVVFSLPLDLHANWIFRVAPFAAGPQCLAAKRAALLALTAPAWLLSAALLFALWPWRQAAAHLTVLALLAVILGELNFGAALKIPFTCSYLPGRSNFHLTFWLWIYILVIGIVEGAISERDALQTSMGTITLWLGLALVAAVFVVRNNRMSRPGYAELRYEETPPDQLLKLDLSGS